MPIKFTPKTEDELNKFENLPPGEYAFTVLGSGEIASKSAKNSGRMMCALKLNVHGPKFDRHVYDYFADWFSEWKLKHFCETAGLAKSYAAGIVDASNHNWKGREGWVKIGIRPAQGNYAETNEVLDYLVDEEPTKPAVPGPRTEDDDVPF